MAICPKVRGGRALLHSAAPAASRTTLGASATSRSSASVRQPTLVFYDFAAAAGVNAQLTSFECVCFRSIGYVVLRAPCRRTRYFGGTRWLKHYQTGQPGSRGWSVLDAARFAVPGLRTPGDRDRGTYTTLVGVNAAEEGNECAPIRGFQLPAFLVLLAFHLGRTTPSTPCASSACAFKSSFSRFCQPSRPLGLHGLCSSLCFL